MIFISYNQGDKQIVGVLAEGLRAEFGEKNVFFDAWSIQPGDGIIERIDNGLRECRFFFVVVTARSLASKMVGLEWRNALMKSVKGGCRFIPIRAEVCEIPPIFLETVYIDFVHLGFVETLRQMACIVRGGSTYVPPQAPPVNLIARYSGNTRRVVITVSAVHFTERSALFVVLVGNQEGEVRGSVASEGIYISAFQRISLTTPKMVCHGFALGRDGPLYPKYPIELVLTATGSKDVSFVGLMRETSPRNYESMEVSPESKEFVLDGIMGSPAVTMK